MTYTMTIILTKNVQYAEQFALLQCFDVILVLPPVQNSVTNYSRALSWMPFSAFLCPSPAIARGLSLHQCRDDGSIGLLKNFKERR